MNVTFSYIRNILNNTTFQQVIKPIALAVAAVALAVFTILAIKTCCSTPVSVNRRRYQPQNSSSNSSSNPMNRPGQSSVTSQPSSSTANPFGAPSLTPATRPGQPFGTSQLPSSTANPFGAPSLTPATRPVQPFGTSQLPPSTISPFGVPPVPVQPRVQKPGGTYQLHLRRDQLVAGSREQIERFSHEVITRGLAMDPRVSFVGEEGSDCGGLRRNFFSELLQGFKTFTNVALADGVHAAHAVINNGKCELLLPQEDNLDVPELSIHYHIGVMCAYIFLKEGQQSFLVGPVFHEAVYAAILSLSDSEIDAEVLPIEAKIRMLDAFLKALLHGRNDRLDFIPALNFVLKGDAITEEDLDNDDFRVFFASRSLVKSENEEVKRGLEENELRSRFLGPEGDFTDLASVRFNREEIMRDKSGFVQEFSQLLFDIEEDQAIPKKNQDELQENQEQHSVILGYGKLGLLFAPIHAMAKGMKAAADHRWGDIRRLTTSGPREARTPDAVRYEGAKQLWRRIQGSLDRAEIANHVVALDGQPPIVVTCTAWIREWIQRPETSDNQVEGLMTFWTGSSNIDFVKSGINLTVQGVNPATITAATCFNILRIPNRQVSSTLGVDNSSKEAFFASLDEYCKPENSGAFLKL